MRMPSAATATPPFKRLRKPSTSAVGHAERLARVRFLTRPPSRKLSRNRMAGGEPRLGTDSIYMAPYLSFYDIKIKRNPIKHMGTTRTRKWCGSGKNLGSYALRSKNFGLEPPS